MNVDSSGSVTGSSIHRTHTSGIPYVPGSVLARQGKVPKKWSSWRDECKYR